jgi:GT2 family glycosyltransferase
MPKRPHRMAVAIVNWNTRDLLRQCLTSVLVDAPIEVVVVDTGSSDGSAEMVRREFPTVRLVTLPHNPGYGAGGNAGVRSSSAEYVLVLNSDTMVAAGALFALTAILDAEPKVAVAGPRVLNVDGSPQRSFYPFPSPAARFFVHEPLATLASFVPSLRERYVPGWRQAVRRRVPWVLGAALAIRRTAFEEVGGFDESFGMYFEEVDLCWRLRARGWVTLFAPVADVVHVGGASTRQRRAAMRARFELSLMQFHRRHHRGATLLLAVGIVRAQAAARYLRDIVRYWATMSAERRAQLGEDLAAWRAVLRASPSNP